MTTAVCFALFPFCSDPVLVMARQREGFQYQAGALPSVLGWQVDAAANVGHNVPVLFNSGTGFGSPNTQADTAARAAFLRPLYATRAPFPMVGRGGEPSGCRFPVSGLPTSPCACHPRLEAGGGLKPTQEATMPKLARALSRLFPAAVSPVAQFPNASEAVTFARQYLAQTGCAVSVVPASRGFAVQTVGGLTA